MSNFFLSLGLFARNHTFWANIDCVVRLIHLIPLVWPGISFFFIPFSIIIFSASRGLRVHFGEGSFRSDHPLADRNLFSLSCRSSEGRFSSLLCGANPTVAKSVLYSTFLTSLRAGAVSTAIKLVLSSPASAKTDEAAILEAHQSSLLCLEVHIG